MKTFFKWLLLAPVALIILVFSVANRQPVSVMLDPAGLLSDGMMKGPNVETTRTLARHVEVPVTASGGVSSIADVEALYAIQIDGIDEVIIGRAGKPVATLSPLKTQRKPIKLGLADGQIWMAPDWKEWPEEEARALGIID